MATKDEHLAQIRGGRDACERLERLQQLQQYEERLAFALAERDAAREELAKLKAAQSVAEAPAPFSIPSTGGESVQWAEPAPPQEPAQGGPFTRQGCYIRRGGADWLRLVDGSSAHRAEDALRFLNAGLEAEKLRARVAELEARNRNLQAECAEIRRVEKARADAAQKRLAQVEARERSNVAELKASRDHEKARADDAEAKLAALGENPIPRALVERHLAKWSRFGAGDVLEDILVGREPGVAS